jgi:hypothetical protein
MSFHIILIWGKMVACDWSKGGCFNGTFVAKKKLLGLNKR